MPMRPNVVDYASLGTMGRRVAVPRWAPLFGVVCAAFACLKSVRYHARWQFREEQMVTLVFAALSVRCLTLALARLPRHLGEYRIRLGACAQPSRCASMVAAERWIWERDDL